MKKIFSILLTILAAASVFASEYCQISNTSVVLADNANTLQKEAAAELKKHLSKLLNTPLVLNGRTPEKVTFFVGLSPEAEKAGFTDLPAAAVLPGKFAVFHKNNSFLFYGWDSTNSKNTIYNNKSYCGTFFAVSYFVQKYLQVKFIMPGDKYTVYPAKAEVNFVSYADIPSPAYKMRSFGYGGKNSNWREGVLWYRRRLGIMPQEYRIDHSYYFINNWNKRFKNRKELFALYNGQRFNGKYPYHFPCTSNPDVVKQIVDDVKEAVKKNPAIRNIHFFCDAPVRSCECENCRKSPAGKFVTEEDHSETVYSLLSNIGNELHKTHPEIKLFTQTKGTSYHQPPRSIKLTDNVVIYILTPFFNQPDYETLRKQCLQWRNAGATVVVKYYPRSPEIKNSPVMNPHRIAEYYRELAGFMDGAARAECRADVPYTLSVLNNYVQSAVMFDPSVNVDKLISEFCFYTAGNAAKELQNFYDSMEKLQATGDFRDDPLMSYYIYFKLKEPRKHLNAALKKAPGNEFLQQLNKDFAEFEKKSADSSAFITSEEQLRTILRGSTERQQPIDLSTPAGDKINFRNFSFFRDFQSTEAQIKRNNDKLVVVVDCQEKYMKELQVSCTENHQGQIWNDDVIELFFGKKDVLAPYLHIMVNAKGVYCVRRGTDNATVELNDFKMNIVSTLNKDSWKLEIELPLKHLEEFISNGTFGMAMYRGRPARQNDKHQFSGAQKPDKGMFRDISGRFEVKL